VGSACWRRSQQIVQRIGFAFVTWVSVLLLTFGLGAVAKAAVITAAVDTFVHSYYPNNNYGSQPHLQVKNSTSTSPTYFRKTYIRFEPNWSGLGFTPGQAASASLLLNFVESGAGVLNSPYDASPFSFSVYGVKDDSTAGTGGGQMPSWAESTSPNYITWNNAGANDTATGNGVTAGEVYGGLALGTFTLTGKGIGSLTFSSSSLVDFIRSDTDGKITFIIVRDTQEPHWINGTYVHAIASREHTTTDGPRLELTAVPEPASGCLLLGLAGCGVVALCRRTMWQRAWR